MQCWKIRNSVSTNLRGNSLISFQDHRCFNKLIIRLSEPDLESKECSFVKYQK